MTTTQAASDLMDYALMRERAEQAEQRNADLIEANRELSESVATLRAERDHWIDAYKAQEAGYNAAVAGASKFAQQRDALAEQLKQAQITISQARVTIDNLTSQRDDFPYEGDEMDALQREDEP